MSKVQGLEKELMKPEVVTLEVFLTEVMQKRNLSITALARGAGISTVTIRSYLNGGRPSIDNCRKLSFYLGVSLGNIISLSYPDVEEKQVVSLIEIYLDLPDRDRRVLEDLALVLHRHLEKGARK